MRLALLLLISVMSLALADQGSLEDLRKKTTSELRSIVEQSIDENHLIESKLADVDLKLKESQQETGAIRAQYTLARKIAFEENAERNKLADQNAKLKPRFLRARNACMATGALVGGALLMFIAIQFCHRLKSEWRWLGPLAGLGLGAAGGAGIIMTIL